MSSAVLTAPNVFVQYECGRLASDAGEPANLLETYTRFHEDVVVEALLRTALEAEGRPLASLVYADLGADHPIKDNPTYLLHRKHGAAGIVVAADAFAGQAIAAVRPRDVVVEDPKTALAGRALDFVAIREPFGADVLRLALAGGPKVVLHRRGAHDSDAPLAAAGYALTARTEAADIFLKTALAHRPRIDSFDVFDTLIARRCIEPHRVFDAMAAETGLADFAARRRAAEGAVAGGPYTLADIYARFAEDSDLEREEIERLMALEVEHELAAVIPIAENLAKVKTGDLLISDMYLGEAVIRRLLTKAGLEREVGLYVSAHGKRSGEIWPHVKAQYEIGRHLGDHPHSDVAMPLHFGVPATRTETFAPTAVEAWLVSLGLRDLGELVREARLRSWHADEMRRRLELAQIQFNLPILVLSSIVLERTAREAGASHLLFASRDCRQWADLHRMVAGKMTGAPLPVEYFYTSRRARTSGSPDYLAYARERLGEAGLVVDACGSGWSMAVLLEQLGMQGRDLFFVHRIETPDTYRRRAEPPANTTIHAVVGPEAEGVNNMVLELANTAEHGSVRDVRRLAGKPLPLFEDDPRPEPIRRRIADQAADFAAAAALVKDARLDATLTLSSADIGQVVTKLYQALCQDQALISAFAAAHLEEDRAAMAAMGMG